MSKLALEAVENANGDCGHPTLNGKLHFKFSSQLV
jgi:hypothetical protein